VVLDDRNVSGAVEGFNLLRDPNSGVQAALMTFDFSRPDDLETLYSLGGVFDAPIFTFYRNPVAIHLRMVRVRLARARSAH